MDELVENFDVADVLGNPARFDVKKAEAINGTHIRRLEAQDFRDRLVPYLQQLGLVGEELTPRQAALLDGAAPLVQERIALLAEGADMMAFLFVDDEALEIDPKAFSGLGEKAVVLETLDASTAVLERLDDAAGPRRTSRRGCARRSSRGWSSSRARPSVRCAPRSPGGRSPRRCSSPWSCWAEIPRWHGWPVSVLRSRRGTDFASAGMSRVKYSSVARGSGEVLSRLIDE